MEHAASIYHIRAEFFFRLQALLVRSEMLGQSLKFRRADAEIEIKFPTEGDPDFDALSEDHILFERDNLQLTSPPPSSKVQCFSHVHAVMVVVRTACQAEEVDDKVNSIAESAITEFIEWQRIRGQTWLALHGQKPQRFFHSRYVDEQTGRPPAYTITIPAAEILGHPTIVALAERVMRQFGTALDGESIAEIGEKLARSEKPGLADHILADALYYGDRNDPEPARAILFAAIACELKVKAALRTKASPETRDLVDVLLANPRDFSMPVAGLFDKVLKAALGSSLREYDRSLYNRIEKLFQIRNGIAHRGQLPEMEQCSDALQAAGLVFKWLDSL